MHPLFNIVWFRLSGDAMRVHAINHSDNYDTKRITCTECDECIGWIRNGSWLLYRDLNFGDITEYITFRMASKSSGVVEAHLDNKDGELLGSHQITHTGSWQTWKYFNMHIKPTSGTKTLCIVAKSVK